MVAGDHGLLSKTQIDKLRRQPGVGILGKIFGPVGFLWTAWRGELPWIAGLTIVTNDLVWWLPFGLIVWHAWRNERSPANEKQEPRR